MSFGQGNDGRDNGQAPMTDPLTSTALVATRDRAAGALAPVRDFGMPAPNAMAATAAQLDAFRELRTRLLAMASASGKSHFTTLLAPIQAGSGASFVTRNLAAAFTLEQRHVAILIDCNLRNPSQHTALGLSVDDGGLFDYLEQRHSAIGLRPTAIPGLHLIPAGRPSAGPREYFSSRTMREIITALRQAPCFIFLDGPPAKGSPDARILSDLADFVILVAGYGVDSTDSIAEAAGLFDPAKFAGVIFNECS